MSDETDDGLNAPKNDRPRRDRPPQRRDDQWDDYDDRPRRRREPEIAATDFLIPTDVSGYSMAACYFGLFSCVFPIVGVLMALVALPCGIVALRRKKKKRATYGSVTGDIRAIIGVICSSLTLLGNVIFAAVILSK